MQYREKPAVKHGNKMKYTRASMRHKSPVWIKKHFKKMNYVDVTTGMIAHMLKHTAVLQAWKWTLTKQPARTNFISRKAISVGKRRKIPKSRDEARRDKVRNNEVLTTRAS